MMPDVFGDVVKTFAVVFSIYTLPGECPCICIRHRNTCSYFLPLDFFFSIVLCVFIPTLCFSGFGYLPWSRIKSLVKDKWFLF